ncbi:hypothetical protein OG473_38090 [Streptomyces anulatus]|uniref:hypothetical protein n=1 Tax=Streptomyces anulatus TaxID=1892 RepID=UPI00324C8B8B|nr:hypothetical protein OG575_38575 [Streptomyces anulatus]
MGWIPDDWNIVAGWLLGFVVANCALGVWFRRRGRADRATIRRYMAEGIGPVAAAEQVEREYYTARVAVCALVGDGVVEVSEEGVLTAVPGAPEPAGPTLRALARCIGDRGPDGAKLYELRREPHFEAYRTALAQEKTGLRWFAERGRVLSLSAGFLAGVGMAFQSIPAGAPVPFLPTDDVAAWVLAQLAVWAVLSLLSAAWPGEMTRRWRRFNEHCRQRAEAELARVSPATLAAVRRREFEPVLLRAPRGSRRPGRTDGEGPGDGGSWADDVDTHSCGSGCGGGGD